jgi:flagellar basal-body rod protein FlgB
MLRTRLDWSQQRQHVLAENVANSDMPYYRARDLAPVKFVPSGQVAAEGVTPRIVDAN